MLQSSICSPHSPHIRSFTSHDTHLFSPIFSAISFTSSHHEHTPEFLETPAPTKITRLLFEFICLIFSICSIIWFINITYNLELVDVDMIVKHVKLKNLRSIISYYKVDTIELSDEIDISVLFEDFCLSMKEYWNISMIDQLESFSFLLSLCKLRKEQNIKIVKAFVSLLTPSENQNIRTVTNNINALWIYVEKHFDKTIKDYVDLLDLLVNSKIPLEATAHPSAYPNLIKNLSEIADKNIYVQCCDEIDRIEDNRQKTYFVFVNRIILLKYGKKRWKIWIKENLSNNMEYEIFQLLYEKVLIFDEKIKDYYENRFQEYAKNSIAGVHTFPDSKVDAIDNLIILLLVGCANEADLDFMRDYTYMSDYLEFIFIINFISNFRLSA